MQIERAECKTVIVEPTLFKGSALFCVLRTIHLEYVSMFTVIIVKFADLRNTYSAIGI